ncbi:FeoA family protein [Salibacter halophilus]|jgi:ferrous iron transport protein A|uniref:Ferrous iron transport protein A n=1 Tax=Salibacter halophilus TaxID=1803916 RepID=A0A6N6M524_9FLAO|nr:ferrous iron transport protein A [Salibacter halophilus]KAB1064717.1 ferrous iron transport protein A [Salibacter halophilus]
MKLSDLKQGQEAIITEIEDSSVTEQLMEMGCLPGELVVIENVAPMGDPIAISVVGYKFSLRKADAAKVEVKIPAGYTNA